MQKVVLLDVSDHMGALAQCLGRPLSQLSVSASQIVAVVDHPADALAYIDDQPEPIDLLVLSARAAAADHASIGSWGWGWRCGRELDAHWLQVAVQEGRVKAANWWQCSGAHSQQTLVGTSSRGTNPPSLDALLSDHSTKVIVCRSLSRTSPRMRDAGRPVSESIVRLWHGSSIRDLPRLKPSGRRLWVSPSSAFATCFAVSPYSNLGFYQGVDRVCGSIPSIYLSVPAGLEGILQRPCSLYEIAVPASDLREIGVQGYEYVIHHEVDVRSERQYDSCISALQDEGVELVTMKTAKPLSTDLANRCRPFRHSVEAFVGMPLDMAICIPSKIWALQFWLYAREIEPLDIRHAHLLQDFLERIWLPAIAQRSRLPEHGYHSLSHCMQVALLGAFIALHEGTNPIPVALAGLLHDSGREGDAEDADHALAALSLADVAFGRELRNLLAPAHVVSLRGAIAGHTAGRRSPDPVVAACWDADRLRLAWERGVDPKFFTTRTGLELAKAGLDRTYSELAGVFGSRHFTVVNNSTARRQSSGGT